MYNTSSIHSDFFFKQEKKFTDVHKLNGKHLHNSLKIISRIRSDDISILIRYQKSDDFGLLILLLNGTAAVLLWNLQHKNLTHSCFFFYLNVVGKADFAVHSLSEIYFNARGMKNSWIFRDENENSVKKQVILFRLWWFGRIVKSR